MKVITSNEISEDLMRLLESTELGTNGARYVHLDVRERIEETDLPLSISIQRNNKLIANITFCQRKFAYYLRYFAFGRMYQNRKGSRPKKRKKNSVLETQIEGLFEGLIRENPSHPLYAYIDIENSRSKLFSERFGFKPYTYILSRIYSRKKPKKSPFCRMTENWEELSALVKGSYEENRFYFDTHIKRPPYVVLKNDEGGIVACAKFTKVRWRINRLPGKLGGLLVKVLPFIPVLNKLINPKDHCFLVPDVVVSTNNSHRDIEALFDSAMNMYNVNSILWFVDPNQEIYSSHKDKISWGLLDKFIGTKKVHLVTRNYNAPYRAENPVFVCAFDLI